MHSNDFNRILFASILLAFLYCLSSVHGLNEYRCSFKIHVKKGQIIKPRESIQNGAKFLKHTDVVNARECYKLCCEHESCDLALMQYTNSSNSQSYAPVEKFCYLFHCGIPSKCRFEEHNHYATISYDRPDEKLSSLDSDPFPLENAKSEYRPSEPEGDDDEEEDLESKSYQPPARQHTKESQQYKDVHSSWNSKSEGRNLEEFGKSTYHSKSASKPKATKVFKENEKPANQQDYQKQENPTKQMVNNDKPVKTNGPVIPYEKVPDRHSKVQVTVYKDQGDTDAALEMKMEELTPTTKKPVQAKVTPATKFHGWREFVDNNPNFPFTIPKNNEKTTQRQTTEKWIKVTERQHPTTEKVKSKKTVRTEPVKTTEKPTSEKLKSPSQKIKETEKSKQQEDNSLGQDSNTKPPVLELPFPQKNVSDVVVIETQHLRIIENKAVLPLAVFLVLAILLLFVVALRLRIVKSKLKRRPFATDDADYLINGMYL